MKLGHLSKLTVVTALVAIGTGFALDRAVVAQQSPPDVQQGVEVLTRGPVHEAFAETVTFNPEVGMVVPKAPPGAIEEMPPEQRPEGDNVTWIPGYWGWDDDRNDYLWVSGIWRALPPGRQWVPGYWSAAGQGFQWISGYWLNAKVNEIEYLPQPPETVEAGPNIASPSPDQIWIPGSWLWYQGRYVWRPGYWAVVQTDWVWVPAHYVWAPRGYVFVSGYWDYSVSRRGVLFAPVHFDAGVSTRQGFSYSPRTVIDLGVFSDHLFLRPRYQHYYFGDYYAPRYHSSGFFASFSFGTSRRGYDPIFVHQRWVHRQDREWEHRVSSTFQYRRDHVEARPPHTLAIQLQFGRDGKRSHDKSLVVAGRFKQMTSRQDAPMRFRPLATEERHQIVRRGQEIHKYRQERYKLENRASDTPDQQRSRESKPSRVRMNRSPITAKSVDQFGKGQTPPQRLRAPKPDPNVKPMKRSKTVTRDRGKDDHKSRGNGKNKSKDKDK